MPDSNFVVKRIRANDEYKLFFEKAFGCGEENISFDNIAEVIAAFKRTFNSRYRFNDFMKGNLRSLSDKMIAMNKQINKSMIFKMKKPSVIMTAFFLNAYQLIL